MRFDRARAAGLDEETAALADDGHADADIPDSWKTALALTDHMIVSPGPLPSALETALDATFSDAELTELALGLGLFHGFSKMLIALGLEPEGMATTVLPTPSPPSTEVPPIPDWSDRHTAWLRARPDLAARWADMARKLEGLPEGDAGAVAVARRRIAELLGVDAPAPDTRATSVGAPAASAVRELAELFVIDVRAIEPVHMQRVTDALGRPALMQIVMALAVYDGIYRVGAVAPTLTAR